ncbi:hypothetical protein P154DRAFT_522674 [Amniculicola lignicola CBS 123094]|uniref:SAP domain-containing protein n=1 Tax=Amniculicola lignicola CBS 123094 TaxID=1392246 RepID=A0A6A5WE68_9PLEO|nr:hypothetical protein P154DRAFT_522674 [Amniculicola lignicola CBS 123094]
MPAKRKSLAKSNVDNVSPVTRSRNKKAKISMPTDTAPSTLDGADEVEQPSQSPRHHYTEMGLQDMKEELRKRDLKVSGKKSELAQRLRQHDHDGSLPVMRAMEAAARKRREKNPPPPEDEDSDVEWERYMAKMDEVRENGATGSPVHDDWGYELSYEKILAPNKRPNMGKHATYFDFVDAENKVKTKIMFGKAQPSFSMDGSAMDWRVAQDLAIPFHKVEVHEYEIWKKMGFTANKKEFVEGDVDRELSEKIDAETEGSAFRK